MSFFKNISLISLCITLTLPGLASHAQGAAVAEARARLVCGSGTVVSATYLPGGLLQATCRQNAPNSTSNANTASGNGSGLGTGGLGTTGVGVGALTAGVVLTIGSSGSGSTTTGTSPSSVAE
ncbi:hypothetical protein [Phaeobacter sp. B1627]|uniref:hypothetical protein n=1 Tax=Phaeobacter sp. B1627 TaxID=2583809 RepID=UPI001119AB57|nr:hypothetical protein [Phaeobacter sp. B1627]TNJ41781.1 hypothetical protein FGE21_12860 [Phaeobacter sp. B1627]